MVFHKTIPVTSEFTRPTFHDVTEEVKTALAEAAIKNGVLVVFSQHTTCSIIIQEQSDDTNFFGTQYILQDMVNGLSTIFPTCLSEGQYSHPGPLHIEIARREHDEEAWWSLNTDAHLRSVMLGRSESIPIVDGELILGEFGRIYFADFDQIRARSRIVHVQIVGE